MNTEGWNRGEIRCSEVIDLESDVAGQVEWDQE